MFNVLFQALLAAPTDSTMVPATLGDRVLLVWGAANNPADIKDEMNRLNQIVGDGGKIQLEHVERLSMCKLLHEGYWVCCFSSSYIPVVDHLFDINIMIIILNYVYIGLSSTLLIEWKLKSVNSLISLGFFCSQPQSFKF